MSARTLLLFIQGLGALTLFAYPGVFLAGIMALGSSGDASGPLTWVAMALVAASFVYPLIWIALWWLSWRALRQGQSRRAFLLSSPPALFTAAGLLLTVAPRLFGPIEGEFSWTAEIEHATRQSPLAGALVSYGAGKISADALHEAVQRANAADLSRVVTPAPMSAPPRHRPRSPLAIALASTELRMEVPLAAVNDGFVTAARLMMARGAQLSAQEIAEAPDLVWLAEIITAGTALPDHGAQQENPVAWVVLTTTFQNVQFVGLTIAQAARDRRALLSTPTRTYGTPLRIALTRQMRDATSALISEGAVLSPTEREIPSLNHHLDELIRERTDLRDRYYESLRRARGAQP